MGKVRDIDRGWKAIRRELESVATHKPQVVVGVTGDAALRQHANGEGLSVVEIASVHEFGAGRVPERSFIRATVDEKTPEYRRLLKNAAKKATEFGQVRPMLKRMGLKVEGDIKQRIQAGIAPALSPVTLAHKGEDKTTPLIDTAQMISSITSEVRG